MVGAGTALNKDAVAALADSLADSLPDDPPATIGRRVVSARVHTEHRHTPALGDVFYERGQRMRRAACSSCGEILEPRRA